MERNITFINHLKAQKSITGTSLKGYAPASRAYLEMLFGPPLAEPGPDDKTTYEWHIELKHGEDTVGFVALYDYKSDSSDDPREEINWHVGAKNETHAMEVISFITTGKTYLVENSSGTFERNSKNVSY